MSRRRPWILADRLVTPEDAWLNRRNLLKAMIAAGLLPACRQDPEGENRVPLFRAPAGTYPGTRNAKYRVDRELTPESAATTYNNFYEFSLIKDQVHKRVGKFRTDPWKVEVTGLVERPGTVDLEDFFANLPSEERVYRFRCVEAWAMTVPWTGFPMRKFLQWVKPKPEARYLRLVTFMRPDEAASQHPRSIKRTGYQFPYYEALSLAEADNELTLLAHGLYGKELPRQNGAPLRLVVPWKYGLKNIKSIVKIEFVAERPPTFWNDQQPGEYSWLSNVEPKVPHPRWSQATERLIPDGERVATLPYNGYAELVAGLYTG